MDFLGISDHNHASAGMSINHWLPGLNQAAASYYIQLFLHYMVWSGVL
jgi:hypothetical protein